MVLRASIIGVFLCLTACSGGESDPATEANYVRVATPNGFEEAISQAKPGERIMLANGDWHDFDMVVRGQGTAEEPIEVFAETPGEVVLTGNSSLRLGGDYLSVSGLLFRDGYTPRSEVISFRIDSDTLANNSRVTDTVIVDFSNPDRKQRDLWVGLYGKNNSFDRNHLEGKLNAGPTLAVRLNTEASQDNNHVIANNYFGPRPVFGSNGGETFRIGTSHYSLTDSNTLVENNYFDRCSGEVEIVSSKSGGNVFRRNTFYASRGTLTMRHGNGTLVEQNLFDGANAPYTGGVRVINARQTIRNNYFKDLTGNRFSGALVIMNGVPNSPINRYHQVDGAVVENNFFDNVTAIELGEGSDAERTAIPVNSKFTGNTVIGREEATPIKLYDDMSGIEFLENIATAEAPESIGSGFNNVAQKPAAPSVNDYGVPKEDTGVTWYPKAPDASVFEGGRTIKLTPGSDVLSSALKDAKPGDRFVLSAGKYHEATAITVSNPISVVSETPSEVFISFERPSLFVLTGKGGLTLEGLTVTGKSAPDGKGNSLVSTSAVLGSGNHLLHLKSMTIKDFDVNRGFSVVSASKGSFFDYIKVEDSSFRNVSGTVFKLDEESDDYGIYNSEYLTISNSEFTDIAGPVASVYRGGRDESTFGPHVDVSGSVFNNIGGSNFPILILHGIQKGSFVGNVIDGARPIDLTYTTGLPVFLMEGNTVDGSSFDAFASLTDLRNRK